MLQKQLKNALERAWAEELRGQLNFPVYASRRSGEAVPPYVVVLCRRVEEKTPVGGFSAAGAESLHEAELRVVHVTDVHDEDAATHDERQRRIELAMAKIPQSAASSTQGVQMFGWILESTEDAEDGEEEVFADVIMLRVGFASFDGE